MWKRCAGILGFVLLASNALAGERDAVTGLWLDERSVLEVTQQGDGLSMRIHAMKDPVYREDEAPGPAGAPRRDFRNPDASLQDRPILGLELLIGYAWNGDRWEGEIYGPESGNTYRSHMQVDDEGRLAMRGYLGMPMFGRTALFSPADACHAAVIAMTAASGVASGVGGCAR